MKAARTKLALAKAESAPASTSQPTLTIVPPTERPVIMEFQPDAIELEQRPPPRLARMTLYGVVLFIVGAVFWASVSQIDEVVVAPGKLITTRPMLVVQPLETSVIRSIEVKVGDTVRAGQTLATLDPTFAASDSKQILGKIQGFDAQIDRITAELSGKSYAPPKDARADEKLQAQLFAQRRAFYDAKIRDFETRIAQAQATLEASRGEEAVLLKRLTGLHEIDKMRETLFDQGTGSRLSYLQGRDLSLDIEANLGRIRGNQLETGQSIEQAKAERQSFIEDFRRASMENLVELRDNRTAAAEELKKAELRQKMAVLTAPADAAVLNVAQRSIGSVAREAEPLFTMVPLDVPLEAEVSVSAKDIGQLAKKDSARIKFDAFPFQKYGTGNGKVRNISQDAFGPEQRTEEPAQNGAPFYKVRITLDDVNLRNIPAGFHFIPGMTVQTEIKTGQRSVISYFLYPLLRGLDESLHEP